MLTMSPTQQPMQMEFAAAARADEATDGLEEDVPSGSARSAWRISRKIPAWFAPTSTDAAVTPQAIASGKLLSQGRGLVDDYPDCHLRVRVHASHFPRHAAALVPLLCAGSQTSTRWLCVAWIDCCSVEPQQPFRRELNIEYNRAQGTLPPLLFSQRVRSSDAIYSNPIWLFPSLSVSVPCNDGS